MTKDRKSTRLNSSHLVISYAVFCLKKKKDSAAPAAHERKHSVRSTPLILLTGNSVFMTCTPIHFLFRPASFRLFFFNDTATTEIYTLSLHDALPISGKEGSTAGVSESASTPARWSGS